MTKKDYILIAKVISEFLDDGENENFSGLYGGHEIALRLSVEMKRQNPRFNKEKFLLACGLNQ